MIWLIIGLIAVYFIHTQIRKNRQKKRTLEAIRNSWGKVEEEHPELEKIAVYYDLLRQKNQDKFFLSDQVWNDLDFDEVYAIVDRTKSIIGQQYLYYLLRRPIKDETLLLKRDSIITHFSQNPADREKIQLLLIRLRDKGGHNLPYLFLEDSPAKPFWHALLPLFPILSLSFAFLMVYNLVYLIPLLATILIGVGVRFFYTNQIYAYISPLTLLTKLLNTAIELSQLEIEQLQESISKFRFHVKKTKKLSSAISRLMFGLTTTDPLTKSLVEYLNLFFLYDVNIYFFILTSLNKNRSSIRKIFEEVGFLDAMISVGSYRHGLSYYCKPTFVENGRCLQVKELFHPLLTEPVPNSLEIENKNVIITGSNMSGKTTFIRSVGVNAILSQTIHTSLAKHYKAPFYTVYSSINKLDDIVEGKSYYMAEVENLYEIIQVAQNADCCLFLLDEIFKGTNTVERIAASYAVLDFLNRDKHIVLVATHDIELNQLLDGHYEPYHFCEIIENDQLFFDYHIKEGISSTRNAIALLKLCDYPSEIIFEAFKLAGQLDKQRFMEIFKEE